jgi:Ca2+-binding EF-hand superfamily protein
MRKLLFFLALSTLAAAAASAGTPPAQPDERLKREWEQRFRAADKDQSRSLDRTEAQAGLPKILFRNFDTIDLDHDARITPEELWAMHKREVVARDKRRAERVSGPPR